jgi:hypothetical protein
MTAEKVVIGSSWGDLLKKKVILSPLEVQGVRAESYSLESSLLKLLLFILTKPEAEEKEPGWFARNFESLTSGWKIWVPEVLVFGVEDEERGSLVFGCDHAALRAFDVTFSSRDSLDHASGVVVLEAKSSKVLFERKDSTPRALGSLRFTSDISDGVFALREAVIESSDASESGDVFEIRGGGGILLDKDELDLIVEVRAEGGAIAGTLIPELPDISGGRVDATAKISGPYDDLFISAELLAKELTAVPQSELSGVLPESVSFSSEYHVRKAALNVTKLQIDRYLANTDLGVDISKLPEVKYTVEGKAGVSDYDAFGRFRSEGTYDTTTEELHVQEVSMQPMTLPEFARLFKPVTGDFPSLVLPPEVWQRDYQVSFSGNLHLGLHEFEVLKTDFEFSVQAAGHQESFVLRASGADTKVVFESFLRGVQEAPLLTLVVEGSEMDGEFRLENVNLRSLPVFTAFLRQGHHQGTFRSAIRGTLSSPEISGSIQFDSRHRARRREGVAPLVRSSVDFTYKDTTLTLAAEFLDNHANVSCNPVYRRNVFSGEHDCRIAIEEFPLRFFMPRDSGKIEFATVSGSVIYQGPFNDVLSGTGQISIDEITVPSEVSLPALTSSIEATLKDRNFVLTPVTIQGADTPLVIQAQVSREQGWNVTAQGEYLLGELIQQFHVLESMSGVLAVDFLIEGPIEDPRISGVLAIRDTEFAFPLGEGIVGGDSIEGSISLSDNRILIDEIKGMFGDGSFEIRGGLEEIFSSDLRTGKFGFSATDVRLEPTKGLNFLANIQTEFLIQPLEKPLFRGSVMLDDAVYESTLSIETVISTLTSLVLGGFRVRGKTDDPLSDSGIDVELDISTPAGLYLDTSVLTAEFLGGVRLSGDLFSPTVTGEVLVLDGEFSISQTDFRIISGRAVFDSARGTLNPTLSLTSEGELRALTGETSRIYLTLGGTLRNPRVSLSSDGHATQRELAQQLGMGGGGSQMRLVDERSGRKVGFREVLSPTSELSFTERFVGLTGVDDVRLETVLAVRTGELVPQVVAGRPLPFDLRGVLSSELAGDRTNAALVEYQLNEVLTTFTGWRSQSVLNPGTTSAANFLFGIRFDETFKGFSFFDTRIKEER